MQHISKCRKRSREGERLKMLQKKTGWGKILERGNYYKDTWKKVGRPICHRREKQECEGGLWAQTESTEWRSPDFLTKIFGWSLENPRSGRDLPIDEDFWRPTFTKGIPSLDSPLFFKYPQGRAGWLKQVFQSGNRSDYLPEACSNKCILIWGEKEKGVTVSSLTG